MMPNYPLYIVGIYVSKPITIEVGSLGRVSFRKGYYIYIGSGGRAPLSRIHRHFRRNKRIRWHIDYLTQYYPALEAYVIWSPNIDEYGLYLDLCSRYEFIEGFGSSDKRSKSHLFYLGGLDGYRDAINYIVSKYGAEYVERMGGSV